MNKIFKVVWSKAKQCYVVVSEVAKNHSGKKKIVVASVLAALAVGSEMTVVNVQATIPEGTVSGGAAVAVGPNSKATALHATAVGKEVEAGAAYSQAIGYQAKTTAQNGVAIGSSGVSGRWTTAGANDAVAIGTGAQSLSTNGVAIGRFSKVDGSSHSVALGTGSEALAADSTDTTSYLTNESVNNSGNGVISVGNKHKATDAGSITRRIVGVASGTEDYDAANIKQLKALEEKTHTRFLAVSGAANKTETDFPNETWTVGKTDATAGTTASELVLKGNYNNEAAAGERAVAVGPWANGIGARSVALGGRAVSNGMQAVALGQATFAYGENTLAVGSYASVNGDNSLAIGTDTFVGKTTRGANNKGVSETGDKTLFGVAIGFNARTYGTASVTLGKQAQADSLHSVVLGESSLSKEGDNTNTTAYLTNDAVNNSGNGVVSIGNADANVTRRIINVAGGTNDTDAVNVKQLKALETKSVQKFLSINGAANRTKANYADKTWTIGSPAVTAADGSVTTAATTSTINIMGNYDNEGARGDNSVALGPWANGIGPRSVALGSNSVANGNQAIALGQSTFGHGENTLAVGSYATVNGENSIAIGTDTYVGKAERNGTGKAISSTGDKTTFAVAIGFSAKAYGGASTVIGKSAQSDIAHSVVLGEGSKAVEADATNGTAYLTGDTVNNSGNGVVSVGNTSGGSNITRRIINVAGGTNDTDAVNVKQLKAVQANEWLLQTKNAGDANATDVTAKTVTGETKKRVVLEAGDNITLENSNGTVKIKANVGVKSITSGNTTALTVSTVDTNGAVTITPNIATNLSANGDAGKLVTAGTVNTALAGKVDTNTFNTALGGKLDKTAERHVKEGSYAVQTDGTVTLTKVDGAGTEKANEAVKITGLATKASVDILTTKVGTVETTANAAKAGLADKADKSTVEALTTEVGKKANAADVTAELGKKANAADVTAELAKKANAADVTAELGKKVNTADLQNLTSNKVDKTAERHVKQGTYTVSADGSVTLTKVDGEETEKANEAVIINGLATKASVDNLTTEVGKKANAADVTAELAKKANAADVTAELAKKANATDVEALTTEVGKKANAADVTAELAKKANATDVEALTTEVGKKANAADVTAELAKKANAADVTAELGKKVNTADLQNLTSNKVDKTAERHVKQGTYTVSADGSVTLTKVDGEETEKANEAVIINGLATKASVDNLTTEVGKKANAADVTAELAKKANAADVTAELAKKANATDVEALTTEVGKKANAADVTAELAKKANATDVEALTTEVGKKANVADVTAELAKKANAADVTAELGKKANATDVEALTTEVGKKANAADVTAELAKKANATDVEALTTEVGKKANAADVTAELAKKANAADVTAELGKKVNTADLQNLTSNKVDKTAERHVKQGTYTVSADGSVTLTKVDGEETEKANEAVIINGLATKASVDNLTTEVGKKANAADVTAELAKKANAADVTAELAKKANATDVEALTTEVGKKANVADVTAELAKKANAADVTAELAKKANATDVTAELAKKANAADVTAELAKKANAADVTAELAKKANAADVTAELAKKANAADVTAELAKKANAADVTAELAKKANADDVTAELAKKANATDVEALTTEVGKKANAADVTAELAKKADAKDLQNLTANKLDKASELHVQKGEYEVAEDGTVTLTKVNGNGEVVSDEAVKIKGLVTRAQIASLGDLSSNGRDGANGTSANKGLTAQDGLNGKTLADKVNALRNGEAGTLVYTDKDGHRLVKAKDGNYYRVEAVLSDGTVKPELELPEGIKPEKIEKPELRIVSPDGTTTPAKLSNVENGTIAENSKDAVNGGQLFAANKNVAGIIGTTLDANGQLVTPTFNVKDKDNKNATTVVQAINLMNDKLDGSKNLTDLSDAGKKVITDLVNVTGDNNIIVKPSVDEKTNVKTFTAKLNDTITLGAGDNAITVNGTNGTITAGNGDNAVTINGTNGIVTAKNVKVNDGVFGAPADAKGIPTAAGNTTTINNYGLSVVSKDAAGNVSTIEIKDGKISGLTPGKGDNDAATVGQVNDAIAQSAGNIGRALEKTSQRVNQVGAHAAALAAMNPLSYDPLRKSQIMAGIGTYSGNQALALGVAHYANENFMFNVGVTMGEGKSMANVGATYRFGTGDDDNIPERYKGGPISSVYVMQDEISALKAENARKDVEYGNKIDMLMERIAMLEAKLK